MPLQLWVQAARAGLRIKEVGVPRLYLDPKRAFGGVLDDAAERLAYYRRVIAAAEAERAASGRRAPRRRPVPSALFQEDMSVSDAPFRERPSRTAP